MKLSHFRFDLPEEQIARYPLDNREDSRLMVIDRKTGKFEHKMFKDIINIFNEGDVFILDYQNWLIQWNGKEANRFEKLKACQCLQEMKARNGRQTTVMVEQGRSNKGKRLFIFKVSKLTRKIKQL